MAFTFFFRDAQTLELAIEDAMPRLRGRAYIHVWDAGCAYGPEVYTLAIMLRERMSDYVFRNVHIHATDIDLSFADKVTSGIFRNEEISRVPPEIVRKYFRATSRSGFVEVAPELRTKIAFAHHDLLSLRPIREGLSLIVCKNVLLHFEEPQRISVLQMFYEALQPGGTLVMEHTQKLPDTLGAFFQQVAPYAQVYRKLEPAFVEHECQENMHQRHGARRVNMFGDGSHFQLERAHRNTVKP